MCSFKDLPCPSAGDMSVEATGVLGRAFGAVLTLLRGLRRSFPSAVPDHRVPHPVGNVIRLASGGRSRQPRTRRARRRGWASVSESGCTWPCAPPSGGSGTGRAGCSTRPNGTSLPLVARWSPIESCRLWSDAQKMASWLVDATPARSGMADAAFWYALAANESVKSSARRGYARHHGALPDHELSRTCRLHRARQ
jgi:hypothetical protein